MKRPYWNYAILCIISFTLVLGLRYGRGNDYFHYVSIFVYGYNESQQIVFVWINDFLKWLGVGKHYFFLFYSFVEILCAMIFLRRYKKYAQYLFPLFLIATIFFDEYQIRQALGFSFVLLCLDALFRIHDFRHIIEDDTSKKNLALVVVYFTLAYSIHSVCGYMLFFMILMYVFYQHTIPLIISIPALLFATYFFSQWFDFSWLNPLLSEIVGEDTRMKSYIENSDKWFSREGYNSQFERNSLVLFAEMLGTITLFILGSKTINKYCKRNDFYTMYNFFVVGSIILNAFRQLELLNRIGADFALFWFVSLSLVLYFLNPVLTISYNKYNEKHLSYGSPFLRDYKLYGYFAIFLIWYAYDYLKYLFMRGSMTRFIWDVNI